jgi:hypothetical protein
MSKEDWLLIALALLMLSATAKAQTTFYQTNINNYVSVQFLSNWTLAIQANLSSGIKGDKNTNLSVFLQPCATYNSVKQPLYNLRTSNV